MKKVIYLSLSVLLMVSCGKHSSEYKKLQMENDSLRLENTKMSSEVDEFLSTINEVQSNFDEIKAAENFMNTQAAMGGEMNKTTREKLSDDMALLKDVLSKNKAQIEKLKTQLQNSNTKSAQFQKTIDRLSAELDEKVAMITDLQQELAKRNITIAALDETVLSLSRDVSDLSKESKTQQKVINIQDKELNTAYYCFGTMRELKDQKIVSGVTVLPNGFNKDYFMAIDVREVKEIPLFAKKARVLTKHPAGSYELVKDAQKQLILKIKDVNNFWSISKYLVVEVNL